jgi:hypothetical protein
VFERRVNQTESCDEAVLHDKNELDEWVENLFKSSSIVIEQPFTRWAAVNSPLALEKREVASTSTAAGAPSKSSLLKRRAIAKSDEPANVKRRGQSTRPSSMPRTTATQKVSIPKSVNNTTISPYKTRRTNQTAKEGVSVAADGVSLREGSRSLSDGASEDIRLHNVQDISARPGRGHRAVTSIASAASAEEPIASGDRSLSKFHTLLWASQILDAVETPMEI